MTRRTETVPSPRSIPAWAADAWKGNRSSQSHADAVTECEGLSEQYRRMWNRRAAGVIELDAIFRTLRQKKIPFVLTGAHGIAGWTGRPRSTKDVDILVKAGRNHARAVKALRDLYPSLDVRTFAGVTGFFLPGDTQSILDVTYPHRADIEETLRTAVWEEKGSQRYRVPTLEAALANKYGAMLAPLRELVKRGQDAIDFATMVKHSTDEGRQPIDMEWLALLGEMVWPGGGGKELPRLVEDVKQGRLPNLNLAHEPRR